MTTIGHPSSGTLPERQRRTWRLLVPEMWASLAIAVIWLSVLFDAVWGPDIVSANTNTTAILIGEKAADLVRSEAAVPVSPGNVRVGV